MVKKMVHTAGEQMNISKHLNVSGKTRSELFLPEKYIEYLLLYGNIYDGNVPQRKTNELLPVGILELEEPECARNSL